MLEGLKKEYFYLTSRLPAFSARSLGILAIPDSVVAEMIIHDICS